MRDEKTTPRDRNADPWPGDDLFPTIRWRPAYTTIAVILGSIALAFAIVLGGR